MEQEVENENLSVGQLQTLAENYQSNYNLGNPIAIQAGLYMAERLEEGSPVFAIFSYPLVLGYALSNEYKERKNQQKLNEELFHLKYIKSHENELQINVDEIM